MTENNSLYITRSDIRLYVIIDDLSVGSMLASLFCIWIKWLASLNFNSISSLPLYERFCYRENGGDDNFTMKMSLTISTLAVMLTVLIAMLFKIKSKCALHHLKMCMNIKLHKTNPKTSIDWLIIYCFTSLSRVFHLYGDVIITGKGLQNLGLCSALRAFEQGGIFTLQHLLWHGTLNLLVSSEGPPHSIASYTDLDAEDLF
jgi:hypothetical protein